MASAINPLAVGGGRMMQVGGISRSHGRAFGRKILPAPNAPSRALVEHEEETREEFIKRMKADPDSWGTRGQKSEMHFSTGRVYIFHRLGDLERDLPFINKKTRSEVVSFALKQIKNLKGHYIEIQFN